MERVAFLLEATKEVLRCMLNPETLVMQRSAGIRPRSSAGGRLSGAGLTDDPVVYTGGGRTLIDMDLLFDLDLAGTPSTASDVRELTLPLWQLAENSQGQQGDIQPPEVRFLWGKSWNIPVVVLAVSERFERFTPQGNAQRSWLRLRLLRINAAEPVPMPRESFLLADVPPPSELSAPDQTWQAHELAQSESLDQLATHYYGNPTRWRLLAVANGVDNPAALREGRMLRIPPKPNGGRA